MAVFTPVTLDEVNAWLSKNYQLGLATQIKGISSGIENSNFFLTTEKNGVVTEYVLTLFERLSKEQLPYYLELMEHLALKGITVPAPVRDNQKNILGFINDKPATIVSRLAGVSRLSPELEHCEAVGQMLAKMHLAGQDFSLSQENLRSLSWWKDTIPQVHQHLTAQQKALIDDELAAQITFFNSADYKKLPSGPSHCDLFRDNVLFKKNTDQSPLLSGFFDFYFAGTDKWLFDLAVTTNDWCIDLPSGELQTDRLDAMLSAYKAKRALSADEEAAWPMMLRAAALRFWISRLWDFYLPRDAELLTPHDPTHFERILRLRRKG